MAADLLATPQDLAALMQRSDLDLYTATMLCEIATGIVQDIAGQRILQVTDTAVIDVMDWSCWLDLPQYPICSIGSITLDGAAVTDAVIRSQRLFRRLGWQTTFLIPAQAVITYTHGLATGSQYLQVARGMTLSLGQVGYGNPNPSISSEAIDDYKVTYAEAMARMVASVTPFMEDRIRNAYGKSAYVTESS